MKMKLIYTFCILAALVIGCASPPLTEMENAREAVFRAENDANAVQYAGGTLARARDSLRRMQDEADSKRYDAAKTHAAEAIAAAEKAIADGRAAAQRAGGESDALIASLRAEIQETERNLNGARYSQLVLDYNALDRAIVDAHSTTDQAEIDQAAGRYQQAMDRARIVRSDLTEINEKIANAATTRKK